MEPVQQATPDKRALRTLASVIVGLAGAALIFFVVAGLLLPLSAIGIFFFSSLGMPTMMGMVVTLLFIGALALLISLVAGMFVGRRAYKAFARLASTRGSRAERRISFAILGLAGIVGLIILSAASVFVRSLTFPRIPAEEREALVALYQNTNGGHWRQRGGWLSWKSPCSWEGVQCSPKNSSTARVISLQLPNNQLKGSIPPELGKLSSLSILRLPNNKLTGPIPSELGNLPDLNTLELSYNQLEGDIPPQLGSLSSLKLLLLRDNQLTGPLPPELSRLASLEILYLDENQLAGPLPPELSDLAGIRDFRFDDTNLCEPADAAFQKWLDRISYLERRGVVCP